MRVLRTAINFVSSAFGCGHGRMSRPFTIDRQTYLVCLDCGRKVFYSTERMRCLSAREIRRLQQSTQPASAPNRNGPSMAA